MNRDLVTYIITIECPTITDVHRTSLAPSHQHTHPLTLILSLPLPPCHWINSMQINAGEHDPLDPEYSILKQRLARRLRYERYDVSNLDLPSITALAERTITNVCEPLCSRPCSSW
jgi:hypothetical protein